MKNLVLITLCLCIVTTVSAKDLIRVHTRIIEAEPSAQRPTEFPATDSTQPDVINVNPGQQAVLELAPREYLLRDATSNAPIKIPDGLAITVMATVKDGRVAYRVQLTRSQPIFTTIRDVPEPTAEFVSKSIYSSGVRDFNTPLWFTFNDAVSKKQIFVALLFMHEVA